MINKKSGKVAVRLLSVPAIVIILFFIVACNPDLVFERNVAVSGNVWSREDVAVFEVEINDTLTPHNLYINLRNTGEYPFSNIFLFVEAKSPRGVSVRDTLEFVLAEPSGKWKGKGFGSVWQNRFYYRQNIRFPETGKYLFEIEQAMRREELPGIVDVGLKVEKVQR